MTRRDVEQERQGRSAARADVRRHRPERAGEADSLGAALALHCAAEARRMTRSAHDPAQPELETGRVSRSTEASRQAQLERLKAMSARERMMLALELGERAGLLIRRAPDSRLAQK